MKIAIVHDHLIQEGGAERVLQIFQEIYPEAPIYTLIFDKEKMGGMFKKDKIRTSFLQQMPMATTKYQWYLPLMPLATEKHDLMDYNIILSNASAFAKGIITKPQNLHICYCHTPTRYLWTDTHEYIKELKHNKIVKAIIPFILHRIRIWDQLSAGRVDKFIANSHNVQKRIAKYYNRPSIVIYPPVEVNKFSISDKTKNYYLAGGRLVPYKKFDLIVNAFNKLGMPLKIFGAGPEEERLKQMAKSNIEFMGKVSHEKLAELYSQAIAFIHPQEEDFGIMAVESMASGRPVIAYKAGGALETVVEGITGKFFDDQTWESLADTIIRFKPENFSPEKIRAHTLQFDTEIFKRKIKDCVEQAYIEHMNR